jgi:hypothetical protein
MAGWCGATHRRVKDTLSAQVSARREHRRAASGTVIVLRASCADCACLRAQTRVRGDWRT